MDEINLSEKYGCNPTVAVCYYCGDDVGLALLGKIKGDTEAPRKVYLDKGPCPKCREFMNFGIILISVCGNPDTSQDDLRRTGGFAVVTEDCIRRIFQPKLRDVVLRMRYCMVDDESWNTLGLPRLSSKQKGLEN